MELADFDWTQDLRPNYSIAWIQVWFCTGPLRTCPIHPGQEAALQTRKPERC